MVNLGPAIGLETAQTNKVRPMDRSDACSERRKIGATGPMGTRRNLLAAAASVVFVAATRSSLSETAPVNDATKRKKAMDIKRNGSRPSSKGSDTWFAGRVRVDPMFQVGDPARLSGGQVTFEPGARTMWHTHPLGQTLIVTSGLGWVQCENGPVEEIRPGDIVDWMEKVSDEQYRR